MHSMNVINIIALFAIVTFEEDKIHQFQLKLSAENDNNDKKRSHIFRKQIK